MSADPAPGARTTDRRSRATCRSPPSSWRSFPAPGVARLAPTPAQSIPKSSALGASDQGFDSGGGLIAAWTLAAGRKVDARNGPTGTNTAGRYLKHSEGIEANSRRCPIGRSDWMGGKADRKGQEYD